jgi:tubulysin polyketide synthase-like protein
MKTCSLHDAVQVLATLAAVGCQVRVEGDALHIHDPHKALTEELRQAINQHKLAILALLLRNTLLRLLQVLDMAQPSILVGVQEDFATAWLAAVRMVGEPWAGEEAPEAWQR